MYFSEPPEVLGLPGNVLKISISFRIFLITLLPAQSLGFKMESCTKAKPKFEHARQVSRVVLAMVFRIATYISAPSSQFL